MVAVAMSKDSLQGCYAVVTGGSQGLGARAVAFLACAESGMMTGALIDFDQSVPGAGNPPPPVAEWPRITGVSFA